jgi:hypothetical protein
MISTASVSALGTLLFLSLPAVGGPSPLLVQSQIQYPKVMQGYQDPVTAFIYNTAPYGNPAEDYSVYATFPYGQSLTYSGQKIADGDTGYAAVTFQFNSALTNAGTYTLSLTTTDTDTEDTITQSGDVEVLNRADPAFFLGGHVVQMCSQPPPEPEPSQQNEQFGATAAGETYAASARGIIDDPIAPTAGLDLDSITAIGDSQITTSLQPFTDEVASDDPNSGTPFQIYVDASNMGTFYTVFELNYSDEQDLPGADAPGSEHGFFGVEATVSADGVTGGIVVPEPGSFALAAIASLLLWPARRRNGPAASRRGADAKLW